MPDAAPAVGPARGLVRVVPVRVGGPRKGLWDRHATFTICATGRGVMATSGTGWMEPKAWLRKQAARGDGLAFLQDAAQGVVGAHWVMLPPAAARH